MKKLSLISLFVGFIFNLGFAQIVSVEESEMIASLFVKNRLNERNVNFEM
jgi:hypothetical protein